MFDQYRYTAAMQHAWTVDFVSSYNSSSYIYMYVYIYMYQSFTSISRESSELLTAPLRLDAACMMPTVECPRHLSAPLLLPEASQHVVHAYVWSSPGDNINFHYFAPLFVFPFPVKALNGLYRMYHRLWVLKGLNLRHSQSSSTPSGQSYNKAVQKGRTMTTSSKDERSCDCCFRWPAITHVWF